VLSRGDRVLASGSALAIGLAVMLGPARAPATIEDQRARLPPPAACGDDPIVGVWQAHTHYGQVMEWYRFELEIHRDPDDPSGRALIGEIRAEFWNGGSDLAEPPACDAPGQRRAVNEIAKGHAEGTRLSFEATSWRDGETCERFTSGYLLDRFSGRVDVERMEFQSVLNADAPEWTDVPTVFRRVRCERGAVEDPARVVVAPPPYGLPEVDGGGGCGFRD